MVRFHAYRVVTLEIALRCLSYGIVIRHQLAEQVDSRGFV